ncbi:LPS translocon maturation chaperone LptM [Leptothrix cholodnii]|uniref:LPS translocon maturation chaperone LptM n=1 Tax=Leptothrix cholodnii TaxID=34029 RepID=UPI0012372C06|nr:lipoprotein [Leptothrix cholodnii]
MFKALRTSLAPGLQPYRPTSTWPSGWVCVLVLASAGLAGCGQKGPLSRPARPAAAQQPAPTAPPAAAAPAPATPSSASDTDTRP